MTSQIIPKSALQPARVHKSQPEISILENTYIKSSKKSF
jgi:hypothetical protein